MLFQRIVSALIFIPFILYCLCCSPVGFLLLIGAVVVLGLIEFYNLVEQGNTKPFKILGLVFSLLLLERAYQGGDRYYFFSFWLLLPWLMAFGLTLVTPGLKRYAGNLGATLVGIIYLGYLPAHLFLIIRFPDGNCYLILLFAIIWATDIAAYGVGSRWGKHKLMPQVSPKKTVEGAIGGLLGAIAVSVIGGLISKKLGLSLVDAVALGLLLGIFGQVGDLIESKLKRLAQVKDSGSLAAGHGGILDVFDSLILTAPVMYGYLILRFGTGL